MCLSKPKKDIDNYKDANLVHYGMYYIRKKFYETGPGCLFVWLCVLCVFVNEKKKKKKEKERKKKEEEHQTDQRTLLLLKMSKVKKNFFYSLLTPHINNPECIPIQRLC